jgi:bacillithiol system protein YtxJ
MELVELKTVDELKESIANSADRAQLLFKHSLTCPISTRAFSEFQSYLSSMASLEIDYKLIVVQKARDVSNKAAEELGVRHESPQAILVRNGRAIWNASHFDITSNSLAQAIKQG